METLYYTLPARSVTVPGSEGSSARKYACLSGAPTSQTGRPAEGKLLRLSDYRPLPTAGDTSGSRGGETPFLPGTMEEALPDRENDRFRVREELLRLLPDLCAAAAIFIMVFVVTAQFLAV